MMYTQNPLKMIIMIVWPRIGVSTYLIFRQTHILLKEIAASQSWTTPFI